MGDRERTEAARAAAEAAGLPAGSVDDLLGALASAEDVVTIATRAFAGGDDVYRAEVDRLFTYTATMAPDEARALVAIMALLLANAGESGLDPATVRT